MEYKIIWSKFAEYQLDKIFIYYSKKASLNVANKIMSQIGKKVNSLSSNPLMGKKEEFLENRTQEYRCLIVSNYKVIYTVDENLKLVKISDVFDARQSPIKLKRN